MNNTNTPFFYSGIFKFLFLILPFSGMSQDQLTIPKDSELKSDCGNLSQISLCIWTSDSVVHLFDRINGNSGQTDGVKVKFSDEDILSILETEDLGHFTQKVYLSFENLSEETNPTFFDVKLIPKQKECSGEVLFSDQKGRMIVQYYGWKNSGPNAGVLFILEGKAYRIGTVGVSPVFGAIEANKRSEEVVSLVIQELKSYPKVEKIIADYFNADQTAMFPKEDLKSLYFDCYFEQFSVPSLVSK